MAKTLTDRISVRVTAKSETDANNQKKNDANNIAKALGKDGDLDDTKASSVASKLGNTITDENGTTWAKSSEVAAAAKELDGEINSPEYDDYVHNGYHFLRTNSVAIVDVQKNYRDYYNNTQYTCDKITTTTYIGDCFTTSGYGEGDVTAYLNIMTVDPNATLKKTILVTRENISRPDIGVPSSSGPTEDSTYIGDSITGSTYARQGSISPNAYGLQTGTLTRNMIQSLLNEKPIAHHGGSKVDTSKSEAQIKEELESKAWAQGKAAKINPIEPNETYIAVTDANGNPLYFLGT